MKLGKSGCGDGLDPDHIYYGGEVLKVWLKRILNRIISYTRGSPSMLEGGQHPYRVQGKGQDFFLMKNYRGITLSSVIVKL